MLEETATTVVDQTTAPVHPDRITAEEVEAKDCPLLRRHALTEKQPEIETVEEHGHLPDPQKHVLPKTNLLIILSRQH
jgi:hypothetical protein